MGTAQVGHALAPAEGEALWFFGTLVTFKAAAAQTGDRFTLIEQAGPGRVATPRHAQPADDESFYVLEGALTFWLGDNPPFRAAAGAFVHIPAGVPHAFRIESATARQLNFTTPRHEAFMRAAGEPARQRVPPPPGAPDMDAVMAAARRYGVEILGPPPGGGH
jgi:quercetin dioxygenase-like cupin family protein